MNNCSEICPFYQYTTCDIRPVWVFKDSGTGNNSYRITDKTEQYNCYARIDNDLIKSQDVRKCDYIFLHCVEKQVFLIELKGADLIHAVKQILSTIEQLSSSLKKFKCVNARIVLSKVRAPALNSSDVARLKRCLKQQYQGELKYSTILIKETISRA